VAIIGNGLPRRFGSRTVPENLGEAFQKASFQIQAYCLMSRHFHLVIETPRGNLCAGMKFNAAQRRSCESKNRVAIARGECDDDGVDRKSVTDGNTGVPSGVRIIYSVDVRD
jgi:hypothetical protein